MTDAALYEAKKAGRNRIQLVTIDGEMVAPAKKAAPHDRRRGSRQARTRLVRLPPLHQFELVRAAIIDLERQLLPVQFGQPRGP